MSNKLFPIMLEVERSMLGDVLDKLDGMPGIAKLNLHLNGTKKKTAQKPTNGDGTALIAKQTRHDGGPRAKDIVMAFLANGPQHLTAIREELEKHGFSGLSSANTNLNELRRKGYTESGGVGIHKLTDVAREKLQEHRQPAALPPPTTPKTRRKRKDQATGTDVILARMRELGGQAARPVLTEAIVAAGFSPRTIDGTIGKLKMKQLIKSTAEGVYELTAKAKKHQPTENS